MGNKTIRRFLGVNMYKVKDLDLLNKYIKTHSMDNLFSSNIKENIEVIIF